MASLEATAAQLAAPGKGLLASDESTGTIGKRFEKYGLTNDEETRRAYRELFYTADIGPYFSGAIMYKETLYQSASDGRKFVDCLTQQGTLPGIKVDEGLSILEGTDGETVTKGLDRLADECKRYVEAGAKFAKWRAVLKVTESCPTERALELNASQLARYARICQATGLVPVVEPEILIDGPHSQQTFADKSEMVLSHCVNHLWKEGVLLEGSLLKPQMIIPGADYTGAKVSPEDVAHLTLRTLKRTIPAAIPGIMFLSGGQTEAEATENLNALNLLAQSQGGAPWSLSFSYGRALQASVLRIWSADKTKTTEAKTMAEALAAANSAAVLGKYKGPHPSGLEGNLSLHETFRGWSGAKQN